MVDVTLKAGTVNPYDKSTYIVVGVVNGKVLDGTIRIDKNTTQVEFPGIKPDAYKKIVAGIAPVNDPHPDNAMTVSIDCNKDLPKPATRIVVDPGLPGPDGYHKVSIKLFDQDGHPAQGNVLISATQMFKIDGKDCDSNGTKQVAVTDKNGITVRIKVKSYDEAFSFKDQRSKQTVEEILLKG